MSRIRVTQVVLWPGLLISTLTLIGAEFVAVGLGWVQWAPIPVLLFVYSTGCVAAVMTGLTRNRSAILTGMAQSVGPVSEAYRLGMSAGAREERQRAEWERQQQEAMASAVGHDSGARVISAPVAGKPDLRLVRE